MKKTYLYAIVVLVIIAVMVSIWFFTSPVGAFSLKQFDFSLSRNPISGIVTQGQSTSSSIIATLVSGKAQTVQLSVSGCPAYTTCSLNPTSGNPTFYSTLTMSTSSSTPVGTYPITISGVGGGKTRTTAYTLTVNPVPCNCSSWTNDACGAGGCSATQRQQIRTCTPSGCDIISQCVNDSSCITNPNSCTDSDGGIVVTTKGTVSGYQNNVPYSYTDQCLNTSLTEYYCSGTTPKNAIVSCTSAYCPSTATNCTVCSNGACA